MPDEEPAHRNITSKKVPGLGWSAGNLTLDKNTITSLLIKGSSDGLTAVSTKSDSVFKIVDENVTTDKQKGDAGSRTSVLFPGKPSDKIIDLDAKQSSRLPDSKTSAHSPQRPAPQVQDTDLLLEEEELLVAAPLPTAHPRTGELDTGINASATLGETHNLSEAGNGTLQHSMDSRTDRITDTRVLKGAVHQQHKEGSVVQGSDGRHYQLKPGPPGPIGPSGKPGSLSQLSFIMGDPAAAREHCNLPPRDCRGAFKTEAPQNTSTSLRDTQQPIPDSSPMKRSVSTLTPQRPLENKTGALFQPMLPLTFMQDQKPPLNNVKPSSASLNNGGALPGQEGTSKEPPYWVTERTQEVFQRSSKRTIERGHSEDTPNSAGVQESVEMRKMDSHGDPQPGLESQGRAASMPRLTAETQPIPDSSPMKRSVSTLTPQRPLEVILQDYSLEPTAPDRTHHHHHHHHHRCHRRRDKDRKQHSLERSPSRQASKDAASTTLLGEPASRDRGRERGRSHERKHHSSSSEKQRYYSCDRYGSRDHSQPKSSNPSRSTSPCEGQDRQGSGSVSGSPVMLSSGASTPCRGRRQLPQTPLTPRPNVTYKTASSSPVQFSAGLPSFSPARLSRGLSEHNALLCGDSQNQSHVAVTRIGSDPYLGHRNDSDGPEDMLTFEDALASNIGRAPRTPYAVSTPTQPQQSRGVPNGYHYAVGVNAGPGSGTRGRRYYYEADQDDWC
ncbi:Voltage-dependent N-type calcium channel subunit alpha-1B [Acipenser ruthenus]|uniref:Voltage-dependent N-type calcium channel subunit alpha-1B n=1 Tax=Acipenser ruthenus TaxID=7906 RepID=A0A444UW71_ACIRT|nr:Voltage-dependent N-type calcium channel subunit alpha-1B [Acipenser ruthenus]